jgi:hypothetical protein
MVDTTAERISRTQIGPPLASFAGELADTSLIPRDAPPHDTKKEAGHPPRCPPEENEEDHVSRIGRGLVQASLLRFRIDLRFLIDDPRRHARRSALEKARLLQARRGDIVLRAALCFTT